MKWWRSIRLRPLPDTASLRTVGGYLHPLQEPLAQRTQRYPRG